jgi:hypothetical protein
MTVDVDCGAFVLPSFIKCLKSLSNLHTLEIAWKGSDFTPALKNALKNSLKRVELPQIKTLILDPAAYPLLKRCRNVENVACVAVCSTGFSDKFLGSLASNKDSKVKRLAVPLFLWGNPSSK